MLGGFGVLGPVGLCRFGSGRTSCLVGLWPVVSDFVQSGRAMSGWSRSTDDSVIVEDPVLVDELVTVVDKKACRAWHRGTVGGGV